MHEVRIDIAAEFLSAGEEYSYIFTSAGWVCYDMNEFNDKSIT